jgi:hypothetical protein
MNNPDNKMPRQASPPVKVYSQAGQDKAPTGAKKTLLKISLGLFLVGLFLPAVDMDPWLPGFNVFCLSFLGTAFLGMGEIYHFIACAMGLMANCLILTTILWIWLGRSKRGFIYAVTALALTLLVLIPLCIMIQQGLECVSAGYWCWVGSALFLTMAARAKQSWRT